MGKLIIPSDQKFKESAATILNLLLGHGDASTLFWKVTLPEVLNAKFPGANLFWV